MHKILLLIFLLTYHDIALGKQLEVQALTAHWKTSIAHRKQLLEKISLLKHKKEKNSRLAEEKKASAYSHQEKVLLYSRLLSRLSRLPSSPFFIKSPYRPLNKVTLAHAATSVLNYCRRQVLADAAAFRSLTLNLQNQDRDYQALLTKITLQKNSSKEASEKMVEDIQKNEEARLAHKTNIHSLLEESVSVLSKSATNVNQVSPRETLSIGSLEQPVTGERIHDPLLQKKFSTHGKGIIFRTKKNADVWAPAKGIVAFKGSFRSQGDILILNHGDQIHTLLMGMDKIWVDMGQSVYAGEKVGSMAHYGKQDPFLYIELRKNGQPLDLATYFLE